MNFFIQTLQFLYSGILSWRVPIGVDGAKDICAVSLCKRPLLFESTKEVETWNCQPNACLHLAVLFLCVRANFVFDTGRRLRMLPD